MSNHRHHPSLIKKLANGMPDNTVPPHCPVDVLLRGAMMIEQMTNLALMQGFTSEKPVGVALNLHDMLILKIFAQQMFQMINSVDQSLLHDLVEQTEANEQKADGDTTTAHNVIDLLAELAKRAPKS